MRASASVVRQRIRTCRLRADRNALQPIAYAVDRGETVAVLGHQPQLAAQARDVRVQRTRREFSIDAPHRFEQMLARQQAAEVLEKEQREVEFTLLQRHLKVTVEDARA